MALAKGNNQPLVRRTFVLGIINGTLFILGWSLIDPMTVLPAFVVSVMGGQMIYVGLLAAVIKGGWVWPQIVLQNRIETAARKLPYYRFSALVRALSWVGVIVVIWYGAALRPALLYALVVAGFALYTSAGGVGLIPFYDVVSKAMPAHWRGRFFGWRRVLGGALAFFLGGPIVKAMLAENCAWPFPRNYAVLALISGGLTLLGLGAFCLAREPDRPVHKHRLSLGRQLLRGPRLFRRDERYRSLIYERALFSFAADFTAPFLFPFALQVLHAPAEAAAVLVPLAAIGRVLANIFWAHLGDEKGNRRLLQIPPSLVLCVPLLALLARALPSATLFTVAGITFSWQLTTVALAMFLFSLTLAGQMLGEVNYLLEIAPERKRPTYIGFNAVVTLLLSTGPILGALLIGGGQRYTLGFALSAVLAVAAIVAARHLTEPREEEQLRASAGH